MRLPLLILPIVLTVCFSCSGSHSSSLESYRSVSVSIHDTSAIGFAGTLPLQLAVEVNAARGAVDFAKVRFVTHIEVDFGDGSPAVECTEIMYKWWNKEIDEISLPHHVYTIPGQFTIKAKVTYWDGWTLDSLANITITVLPPEDAGS